LPDGTVRIEGRIYPHGIFMHPPPPHRGAASITFRIDRRFARFRTEVTLNDGPRQAEFPSIFSVYGDGRLLWRSAPISSQANRDRCLIDITAVELLKLEVGCTGEPRGAHAVWIDPRVER
jgi:hypothetical protein